MKGITYYRLSSPYAGDVTKNCSLTPGEMDGNFFTLEGRDIQKVYAKGNDLVIGLLNGETIVGEGFLANCGTVSSIELDGENGVLTVTEANGATQTVDIFTAINNALKNGTIVTKTAQVNVDETMVGSGTPNNPIGLNRAYRTGQPRPVKAVLEGGCACKWPEPHTLAVGDRYLVKEVIPEYGYLYDYSAIRKIACELHNTNSPWRIPTKDDWDDMLNAIEVYDQDRTHTSANGNKYLGRLAGKFLKGSDDWRLQDAPVCHHNCNCHEEEPCKPFEHPEDSCGCHTCHPHPHPECHTAPIAPPIAMANGIDKFGFKSVPAGLADDGGNFGYFGERSIYWTATNSQYSSAYTKRLEWDRSDVHQDILAAEYSLSLRLVRDYDGTGAAEQEEILGDVYDVALMPSAKNGKAVWTAVNFRNCNPCLHPVTPNGGANLTSRVTYSIHEWMGRGWHRITLGNGDAVVVEKYNNGDIPVEVIVKDDKLLCAADVISNTVTNNLQAELTRISDEIEAESQRAKNSEALITSTVAANEERIAAAETRIMDAENNLGDCTMRLENEIAARQEGQQELKEELNTTNDALSNLDAKVDSNFEANCERMDGIDTALSNISNTLSQTNENLAQYKEVTNAAIAEAKGDIPSALEFDPTTGTIKIVSADGTNDLAVNISLNFGTF